MRPQQEVGWVGGGFAAIATLTVAYTRAVDVGLTTVALSFFLVVVVLAAFATKRVAVAISFLSFASFNFFFLPPTGTFTIAQPEDLVALMTLLAVSLAASQLATGASRRAQEALVLAEQRNLSELAKKSTEIKAAIFASVSRDLKRPVTALTIAANTLRASWGSEELRRDQVELVAGELASFRRRVENMIQMARFELEAVTPEREWVDGATLANAAITTADRALLTHHVEVVDRTTALEVRVDPRLTAAALAHLLDNAAQYSRPGTAIVVELAISDAVLRIDVRDHGPGLRFETLLRLDHPAAYESTMEHSRFASGCGLVICQHFLQAEGGCLTAANDPNGGAVFTVRIPAAVRQAIG
jgi:two-component system sensor histidine kinase KdpD